MPEYLTKRNGYWQFARRVPLEFSDLDTRGVIKHSTKVAVDDDKRGIRASRVANAMNRELEAYWRGLVEGKAEEATQRYAGARRRARVLGFDYIETSELADRPTDELLQRFEKLAKGLTEDKSARAALLGYEQRPAIKLSEVFPRFEHQSRTEIADMSPTQLRVWRNGYTRAMKGFIEVIGDKELAAITHANVLDYVAWLEDRIAEGEIVAKTANKNIAHISRMIKDLNRKQRLGLPSLFADMSIRGEKKVSRPAFSIEWVQEKILAEGALMGLKTEQRRAVMLIAETGLRLSEAINLQATSVHLENRIPYIHVKPEGRRLKSQDSERQIPLVGCALAVMRLQPRGFPEYVDRGPDFSAEIGRYLTDKGLRPTPEHTLYSLRHTFEDRLKAAKASDTMIDELMGHASGKGYKYGSGHPMETKLEVLQRIAFKPPASV